MDVVHRAALAAFCSSHRAVHAGATPPTGLWYGVENGSWQVEVGMDTHKGRAKFSARISIQMSDELRSQLQELARREYGGDLQALLRETLHARVDKGGSQTDHMQEVMQDIDGLGQVMIRQHEDLHHGLDQLLAHTNQLLDAAGVQHPAITAIAENLSHLRKGVAAQTDALARLTERVERRRSFFNRG